MDILTKKLDKLEIQNIVLEVEIKKLKEIIVALQQKLNIQTLNHYGCEDSENSE
jgi:recombinational DNA repair protein RecR